MIYIYIYIYIHMPQAKTTAPVPRNPVHVCHKEDMGQGTALAEANTQVGTSPTYFHVHTRSSRFEHIGIGWPWEVTPSPHTPAWGLDVSLINCYIAVFELTSIIILFWIHTFCTHRVFKYLQKLFLGIWAPASLTYRALSKTIQWEYRHRADICSGHFFKFYST